MDSLCHSEKRVLRPWLTHELAQLREMYERGDPVPTIAAALNVSEMRVKEMARRSRIFRSPEAAQAHAVTPSWRRIRAALAEKGSLTVLQLGDIVQISPGIIRRELKIHRVELRIIQVVPTGGKPACVWALADQPLSITP